MVFPSRMNKWPGATQEKTSDAPKLKVILQHRRPELFRSAKDTKGRKDGETSRLKIVET